MQEVGGTADRARRRGILFAGERRGAVGNIALPIWTVFMLFPIANAIGHQGSALGQAGAITAATMFVVAFIALVVMWRRAVRDRYVIGAYAVTIVVATVLTIADRPGWAFLFTYCAACTSLISPANFTLPAVGACVLLAGVTSALGGADGGSVVGFVASTVGVGLLMVLLRDLRNRNDQLTEARAELARLAVAEERERFARDMHDLLGHTLSVIALKAELAGRLLPERAEEAEREIVEVESVARSALVEVREAVSGYRQPTLDGELAGARMALAAAGIDVSVEWARVSLDPAVEAVLAWTVREGATNVIRHSGASRCEIRIAVGLAEASVEITDNGRGVGSAMSNGSGFALTPPGHGLAGLTERARLLHGDLTVDTRTDDGFRMRLSLPIGERNAAAGVSR